MFTGTLESALLLASLAMAVYCYATYEEGQYSKAYHNEAVAFCGQMGMLACGGFAISSAVGLTFVAIRKQLSWVAAMAISILSLGGLPGWIYAGLKAINHAKTRGGDWVGLAVVGSAVDGVAIPALFGIATLVAIICIFVLRRRVGS